MHYLFKCIGKTIGHGLTIPVFIAFFATTSFAAELLPFPSPNRVPQVQQSAPRYSRPQPQPELEQFRRDITEFPCQELSALYSRMRTQFEAARTAADQEYYSRFLNELYREMSGRCNK